MSSLVGDPKWAWPAIRKPRAARLPLFPLKTPPSSGTATGSEFALCSSLPAASPQVPMLWASKRRKSRPDIHPPRRSSVGSPRLPFAPVQSSDMPPAPQNNIFIGRAILSPDEQQQVARQSPSPPPNFSLPRREPRREASSSSDDSDKIYQIDTLKSFSFGPATQPVQGRSIGPLDEIDEDDMRRRGADETPRQSVASTAAPRRDPRTPSAYYSPPRSDAASHHTFGTSDASSVSSPSRSGSRSRTTSSTTHTSVDNDTYAGLAGVTFNPMHHHPTIADVEFDSEEEFSNEEEPYDAIEVSSARGGGSYDGAHYEAFERQLYRDPEAASLATTRRPSLPMAIPGMSPDMDIASRRDREGSLTTLRRPSRSLDDQVSVLTLGEGGSGVPAPAPGAASVPESDSDWRSLSARASLRESPTSANAPVSTTVTFAPSSSSNAANINTTADGASASFDGLDLDWGEIAEGITGLDMGDIAVHSSSMDAYHSSSSATYRSSRDRRPSQLSLMLRRPSTASGGSVMYDPDTFSAAVRAWGGEGYERQRKCWTFRRDLADGRGQPTAGKHHGGHGHGGTGGGALSPVTSITGGRLRLERVPSMLSGHTSEKEKQVKTPYAQWRGMALNAEEIWNSSLVGSFKVRRIELRPQKPQQRVTIDPFRGPYTLGPKPPHDGAYTNIHKHSKVMAFSIHRHYKPHARAAAFRCARELRCFYESKRWREWAKGEQDRRRPTAMILLAPRHVQEAYTSTNTTKGLRSHGLLDEGRDRDRERERENQRSVGSTKSTRSEKGREKDKEKERRQTGSKDKDKDKDKGKSGKGSSKQTSSAASVASTYRNEIVAPPLAGPSTHTYPPSSSTASLDTRDIIGPTLAARSTSSSRRRRDSMDMDDSDSDTEARAAANDAQRGVLYDGRKLDRPDGVRPGGALRRELERRLARAAENTGTPDACNSPSSLRSAEERKRRHDVLSNSFEDVGLLPPKKSTGGTRTKKPVVKGIDIFAQVPADALFMLLPLWPGPTDPVSERNATRQPHEIPTEQRQYLLVSYKPTDERPPTQREGKPRDGKKSTHSSPTSSGDNGTGKGCDILLTSYHISARLVSHADLQGSGVRVPDEGLAVLGPWHEAWLTMPQIATRDHGLLVIGSCNTRDAGIEFDPEGLVKMGLCIPVPPEAGSDEEEPVAELTPIGRAVLEMAWIGCIAVTSFGPVS
ncbi:hypothetical protein MSAN_00070200 [Mycena sanguinolenta]|uniref:Uncharacterized protein n=1 Tax=Mycena sanguinolenta TaxID=230812 RepID=A0A8H7DME9_9AGAR|nr:hypothetical protein MSAN_00070200 [Mycena sanguinolenta]